MAGNRKGSGSKSAHRVTKRRRKRSKRFKKARLRRTRRRPASKRQAALLQHKLREAARLLRKNKGDFNASVRSTGVSRASLARFLTKNRIARKVGSRWAFYKRGRRSIHMFTAGEIKQLIVSPDTAAAIGRHLSAIGQFVRKNDRSLLTPYEGQSIKDLAGNEHVFETRPNVIHRLYAGREPLEELYRIMT